MKVLSRFSQVLVAAALLFSGMQLMAEQPGTVPPRGKAYGYYMKDGTYVLFVYEADGTRSLTLSRSKPKTQYQVSSTDELRSMQVLGTITVQADGTARYVDTIANIPHRFYQVTPVQGALAK